MQSDKVKTKVITIEQQAQPNDPETEQTVLATLVRYNSKYNDYADLLSPSLFYDEKRKAMFKTISGVIESGNITDPNSLMEYANSHDVGYKLYHDDFKILSKSVSLPTLKQDIERLRNLNKRRILWEQFQIAAQKSQSLLEPTDNIIDEIIKNLNEIQDDSVENVVSDFGDALADLRGIIEDNQKGLSQAIMTGYQAFDKFWLLRPCTLTVIAAFTSVGKSALAMNIALAAAQQGIGVGYYSLEMAKSELAARAVSYEMSLSAGNILNRKLEQSEVNSFEKISQKMATYPLYIDENITSSFEKTKRSIRALAKTKKIKLAIIDYLQIYAQIGDSTESAIASIARDSKNLSRELNIAIILLSQLNRSGEHPTVKMLRGSGQIEESSDNIVLIDRPGAYPNNSVKNYGDESIDSLHPDMNSTALFIVTKGRNVGYYKELVGFEGKYTHFYELDKEFMNKSIVHQRKHDDFEVPF